MHNLGSDQKLPGNGVGRISIFRPQKSHDPVGSRVEKSQDPVKSRVEKSHDPVKLKVEKSHDPVKWRVEKSRDPVTSPPPQSPGRYLDILKMLVFFEGLLSLTAILSPTKSSLTK